MKATLNKPAAPCQTAASAKMDVPTEQTLSAKPIVPADTADTAVDIRGLTKRYGTKTAVDRLNLTIQTGELFAMLGVNGAGKSTTIRMLSCLTEPDDGDALLMGRSIRSEPDAVKALIGVSPQETAVAPNLTVRENLELMAGVHGIRSKEARSKADHMIELFSLQPYMKQRSRTLSGGWQRRLSIAMSLIGDPQILFLDEPTLGLDVLARRGLWSVITDLKKRATIILTTHYLEEAAALADRICIIRDGGLKALGTADELKRKADADNFEEAFVTLASGGTV